MAYVKGLTDSMLDIIATVSEFIRLAGYSEFLFSSTGRLNPLSRAIIPKRMYVRQVRCLFDI